MRSKISRIIMTMSLVLCMAISMFAINTNAADTKADSCDSLVSVKYTVKKAGEYLAGNNSYPEKEGYLFAGWYTVEASKLPASDEEAKQYAIRGSVPDNVDYVYALFVPEHVLSIKAQVSATLIDDKVDNDTKTSFRFVTTVNSLLYQKVGFEVTYTKSDGTVKKATSASDKVYKSLYVAGTTEHWEVTPQELFCGVSKYFKACTVTNVPEGYYSTGFTVKPYWITLDGDKVYGIEATKTIADGCIRDEVWVSSQIDPVPTDAMNYGSYTYPYATLDYALAHVKNGGIVHMKDSLTIASGTTWTAHNKNVTVTGNSKVDGNETLEFAGTSISINDGVTFTALELKVPSSQTFMYAEGNKLVIKDDVTFTNSSNVQLFGGSSSTTPVASTHLEVYAGTYSLIAGGTRIKDSVVSGDTNVVIGGETTVTGNVYGAGYRGIVNGDTHVEVKDDATLTSNLYGAGYEATNSVVKGSTNIKFAGKSVKNIFGGSYQGTNGETHVVMAGGSAEQIFGGSQMASMSGNTDVQLLGGTVGVRVYGGCFNNYTADTETWANTNYTVNGYTSVTFGPDVDGQYANLGTKAEVDATYYAVSRYTQNAAGETGVFIVNDYNVAANPNTDKAGYTNLMDSYKVQPYHYLVKATSGGEVYSAGDKIYIKPDQGMNATVTIDGEEVYFTEKENYYQLPALSSSSTTIIVNFEMSELFYRNDKKTSGADPYVLDNKEVDGYYYMYVTSDAKNIYCYRSTDLMDWEAVGNTLDTNYPNATTFSQVCSADVWAPEVIYDDGLYYMFFSATPAEDTSVTSGKGVEEGTAQRQLMVATSTKPDSGFQLVNFKDADSCGEDNLHTYNEEAGKFELSLSELSIYKDAYPHYYAKYLFLNPEKYSAFLKANGNGGASSGYGGYTGAIDPHPFVDSNGDKYLYWKIEQSPTRICAVQMENWLQPIWNTAKVLTCYQYYTIEDWHNKAEEKVTYELSDNNEGPEVIEHNGKYYLTYSVNKYAESTYQVGIAVADSPLGTFRKLTEAEGGLLLSTTKTGSQEISGAGHHSFVTVGEQLYIVYHRHNDAANPSGARNHAIDEVQWITIRDKDGKDLDVMYVNGPTCTMQPKIEDYSNYINIADEDKGINKVTITADTEAKDVSCLTDGLLSTDKYADETFIQYIKETSITETTTFTFDFAYPRTVRGIMVYNSKMRDTSFENISKIELVCEEDDGEEVIHTIENVEFNPEYYTDDYVISGAAAIAEISKANVRTIRITVDVPKTQETVGISEIRILGEKLGEDATYEATIGDAYYKTLEGAIAAAEKMENATITNLSSKKLASIAILESKNGTVTTDKKNCLAGETVAISAAADEDYYCYKIEINGEAVELDNINGTYNLVTTEGVEANYEIKAYFAEKIFNDNSKFNLLKQNEGIISVPSTSEGSTGWVTTVGNYNVIDATLKDYSEVKDGKCGLYFDFNFENGKNVTIRFIYDTANTRYQIQSAEGLYGWSVYSYSTKSGHEALYDEVTGEGIPFRMARVGTTLKLYLNGTTIATLDLTKDKDGNDTGITADMTCVARVKVEKSSGYEVKIPFKLVDDVIFDINNEFNLEAQNEGIISVPATSDGDTGWVKTLGDYNVISTTVKDYAEGKNHEYAIVSSFYFSNGKHASFRFYYHADMDRYQLQSADGIFAWSVYKYFYENDSEGLYAKATEEGIPFKMVREGAKLKLYFNETLLRTLDLTTDSSGNATGITADTTCIAQFRVYKSTGYEVTIPFELADKSENVAIEISDSENGSIVTDKAEYLSGEMVTLIAKAALGYDCSKIEINGEEVAIKDDGTYSFEATEDIYEITGCFEQTESYENISFKANMSILGDSISTYAGVSNNAEMNDTIGNNNVYYSASQLQQNQTYWGLLLEKYGLELCVNNSTGGGRVSADVGTDGVRLSGVKRSVELHNNDGETPDIIVVYMGTNDFLGSVDLTTFESTYKEMLNNMLETYGEAEILCFTVLPGNNSGFADRLDEYNAVIRECVGEYADRVTLVDIYEKSGITWDNFINYTIDNIHPNAEGMKLISYVLEEAITNKEFYEAQIGDTYYGTLEEAVAAAKADKTSETVEITVLKDVELTSQLAINRNIVLKNASGKDVVIRGSSVTTKALIITSNNCTFEISGTEDGSITVDGESINRIVLVQNGTGCTFTLGANASIINGRRDDGWGAGFYNQGTAYLYGDITGNTAGYGAGIRNDSTGTVNIYAGTYSNNTATVDGGAVYNSGGTVNILGGNFTGNTATGNGGVIMNKGTLNISGGNFMKNTGSFGGVIRNESSGTVNISAGTYSENNATTRGGVIYNFGTLEITGGTFTSNTATSSGGVLHAQWDGSKIYTVTIANAAFYNNSSADGGVMLCTDATITNCTFGGYDADGNSNGNSASNRGGVICQWSAGTITVSDCTFINNTATNYGNALYSSKGTITVSSSRINASDAYETAEDYIIINALPEAKIGDVSYDTLEAAVEVANADTSGEPVEITVLNHVQLEKELTIKGNIVFSTLENSPVVISGDSSFTGSVVLIRINSGKTLNIAGTITVDGNDIARSALIQNDGGSFTLGADAAIVNAMREGWGAAFFNQSNGTAHLYGDFRGNVSQAGAAVRNASGSTVYIYGGTYESNTATARGGAIINQGTMTITTGIFKDNTVTNTADLGGGAIDNQGTLTINGGTFQGNTAKYRGGAIYNEAAGTLTITGGTFQANTTVNAGGAIWCATPNSGKTVSIKNANFYSNLAIDSSGNGNGGAILCYTATIENCDFDGNEASNRAGAVCQWSGTITITGCSFANNTGVTGKILYGNGTITVTDSTGITSDDVYGANVTISNSTSEEE